MAVQLSDQDVTVSAVEYEIRNTGSDAVGFVIAGGRLADPDQGGLSFPAGVGLTHEDFVAKCDAFAQDVLDTIDTADTSGATYSLHRRFVRAWLPTEAL